MEGLLDGMTMEPVPTSPVKNGGTRVGKEGRSAGEGARWWALVAGKGPTRHNLPLSAHHHHLRSAMEGLLDGTTMEPVPTCPVKNGGTRVGNKGRSAGEGARWRAPVAGKGPTRHNPFPFLPVIITSDQRWTVYSTA